MNNPLRRMIHIKYVKRKKIRARKWTSQIRDRCDGGEEEVRGRRGGWEGWDRKRGEKSILQRCLTQWPVLQSLTLCISSLSPSPPLPPFPPSPPFRFSLPPSILDDTSLHAPRRVNIKLVGIPLWARIKPIFFLITYLFPRVFLSFSFPPFLPPSSLSPPSFSFWARKCDIYEYIMYMMHPPLRAPS